MGPEWRTSEKKSLKKFSEQSYKSSKGLVQRFDPINATSKTSINSYIRWMVKRQTQPLDNLDKLEQYISKARLIEVGSLISWWLSPTERSRFLLLSSMAIDILSIPEMFS